MTRLQGTDGVRRPVKPSSSSSLKGASPQEAFIDHGVITEQFAELYCYCRVRQLIETGAMKKGETFVIGWDPRDVKGLYTGAAARGLAKAGANVAQVGVAPTPAVALYMQYLRAAGSIVVTASHNPAHYNGIKIFTRNGLKLLPPDDEKLSERVLETPWSEVERAPVAGEIENHHAEAIKVFTRYSLDPENSWIADKRALAGITLVVDASNGALSGCAGDILSRARFADVITVNDSQDGDVNVRCGVAEIEGLGEITAGMVAAGARFENHKAITTLFEQGRAMKDKTGAGEALVCGAVFDGDGDRFFRLDYNPGSDSVYVLTGDETSALQARARKDLDGGLKLFMNTVESDLNAAGAAAALGYDTELTGVGDKWILLKSFLESLKITAWKTLRDQVEELETAGPISADELEKTLNDSGFEAIGPEVAASAMVGAEESGHNITPGVLTRGDGSKAVVFHGNGLKSCLNTFAATAHDPGTARLSVEEKIDAARHPFTKGFKKTMYIYYVDKTRWQRDSESFVEIRNAAIEEIEKSFGGATVEEMQRFEEPDMLYLKIIRDGAHTASVFVRNSGTEDKTGISLRGPVEQSEQLLDLGGKMWRRLAGLIKDFNGSMGAAEHELLEAAVMDGVPEKPVAGLDESAYARLLNETGVKQGLLTGGSAGAVLTDRGKWYLKALKKMVRN